MTTMDTVDPIPTSSTIGADAAMLAVEAQFVIVLRLLMIALGDRDVATEIHLMVSEKVEAFFDAAMELTQGLATGEWHLGLNAAVSLFRARVQANATRLTTVGI